jgi:hypothetical protein
MKLVEETDDVVEAVNDFCSVHTLVAFSIHKTTNSKSSGISDDSTELSSSLGGHSLFSAFAK